MTVKRTYCDYNATAPLRPQAREAILETLDAVGNASSVHAEGRRARSIVERARDSVADAVGACRDEIVFTGGGTEAVSAAILGAWEAIGESCEFICSGLEHDAVSSLANAGPSWPVLQSGIIDFAWLEERAAQLQKAGMPFLVSLMAVNNETGVIQDIQRAARIVSKAGGRTHCDAIQAFGKIGVSVFDFGADYISVSSHKVGGPQGVGAMWIRPGAPWRAQLTGGGQELGRRAGTENVAGIAGFAAAATCAVSDIGSYEGLRRHRDNMERELKESVPGVRVFGDAAARVAGTSCFGLEGMLAETQVMALDLAGVAASAGSACSSGKVRSSRVLAAMGESDEIARCAIRASFGWASQAEDFATLTRNWIALAKRMSPAARKTQEYASGGR